MLVFYDEYLWDKHTHTLSRFNVRAEVEKKRLFSIIAPRVRKWTTLCTVLTQYDWQLRLFWNALLMFTRNPLAYLTIGQAWCMRTCCLFFHVFFYTPQSENRMQINGEYSEISSQTNKAWFVSLCVCFRSRIHLGTMPLDVWHITPWDQRVES